MNQFSLEFLILFLQIIGFSSPLPNYKFIKIGKFPTNLREKEMMLSKKNHICNFHNLEREVRLAVAKV